MTIVFSAEALTSLPLLLFQCFQILDIGPKQQQIRNKTKKTYHTPTRASHFCQALLCAMHDTAELFRAEVEAMKRRDMRLFWSTEISDPKNCQTW